MSEDDLQKLRELKRRIHEGIERARESVRQAKMLLTDANDRRMRRSASRDPLSSPEKQPDSKTA